MDPLENDTVEEASIQDIKQIVRIIRPLADTLEPVPIRGSQVGLGQDGVDGDGVDGAGSFVSTIRTALDLIYGLLDTKGGTNALIFVGQNHKAIFTIVKRFSELLGPVTMLYSIAAGLCYFDYRMNALYVETFKIQLESIDKQVKELKKNLKTLQDLMTEVTSNVQSIVSMVSNNADHINRLFDQMEEEIVVANIHVRTVEELVEKLDISMSKYRRKLLTRNSIVAFSYASVVFGLFQKSYIDFRVASVGMFAGAIPFLFQYFWLSVDLQELLIDLKRKEMNNVALKTELDIFEVRMRSMKKTHDRQNIGQTQDQRVR